MVLFSFHQFVLFFSLVCTSFAVRTDSHDQNDQIRPGGPHLSSFRLLQHSPRPTHQGTTREPFAGDAAYPKYEHDLDSESELTRQNALPRYVRNCVNGKGKKCQLGRSRSMPLSPADSIGASSGLQSPLESQTSLFRHGTGIGVGTGIVHSMANPFDSSSGAFKHDTEADSQPFSPGNGKSASTRKAQNTLPMNIPIRKQKTRQSLWETYLS